MPRRTANLTQNRPSGNGHSKYGLTTSIHKLGGLSHNYVSRRTVGNVVIIKTVEESGGGGGEGGG